MSTDDQADTTRSSFGEAHLAGADTESKRNVFEGPLKIYRIAEIAVTFAGNRSAGEAFVSTLEASVSATATPDEAIEHAARDTVFPVGTSAQILIGFYSARPRLLLFKSDDRQGPKEIEHGVHIGNVPPQFVDLTNRLARPHSPTDSERWLINTVALLQSYGMHDNLMKHGIGGAFASAWVDDSGMHWQPDTLFVLHDDLLQVADMAGVLFRDDVMNVFNSLSGFNRIAANVRPTESMELMRQRMAIATEAAITDFDTAKFGFLVFLNLEQHIVAVVEMKGEQCHRLVKLEPVEGRDGSIGIYWSPELQHKVSTIPQVDDGAPPRDICVRWEPFDPPPIGFDPRNEL